MKWTFEILAHIPSEEKSQETSGGEMEGSLG
jgi:hypothetical protein